MSNLKKITVPKVSVLAMLLISASPVHADLLSFSGTQTDFSYDYRIDSPVNHHRNGAGSGHPRSSGNISGVAPISSQPLSIQQFDPALGTLNSVTLTLSGQAQSTLAFNNLSTRSAARVWLAENTTLTGFYNSTPVVQEDFQFQTAEHHGRERVPAGGTYFASWDYTLAAATVTYNSGTDLANFTAPDYAPLWGTFEVQFDTIVFGANYILSVKTMGSMTASVIYDYTPVPEPSALSLLLLAAGGFGFWHRSRR